MTTTSRGHAARVLGLILALLALVAGQAARAQDEGLGIGRSGLPSYANLLKRVTPAVVNISVQTRALAPQNPLLRDPFFRRFFNLPDGRSQPEQSAGSGVIIDAAKGYVLTNHHVIENANQVVVTLKDRRRLAAKLLGSDPGTDIALLQVEVGGLSALAIGDSEALEVGDIVFAIGNPFGIGQTVTQGIVSALGRTGLNMEGYEDFIQTDASINPGNSGGALVNLRGELVGINSAIIGPAGGNVGIGFAVPSRMARQVVDQLLEFGEVRRGRLGIQIQDLTPELAEALGLRGRAGAVISRVEPGSTAEEAGLQAGDVVTAVNGEPTRNASDLRNQIGLVRAGQAVTLVLQRDGGERMLTARVGATQALDAEAGYVPQLAGATARDMQPGDPHHGEVEGILIEAVDSGSPAWRHGMRPGDIIVALNRRRVRTLDQLTEALKTAGNVLALNLVRGDATMLLIIQ